MLSSRNNNVCKMCFSECRKNHQTDRKVANYVVITHEKNLQIIRVKRMRGMCKRSHNGSAWKLLLTLSDLFCHVHHDYMKQCIKYYLPILFTKNKQKHTSCYPEQVKLLYITYKRGGQKWLHKQLLVVGVWTLLAI